MYCLSIYRLTRIFPNEFDAFHITDRIHNDLLYPKKLTLLWSNIQLHYNAQNQLIFHFSVDFDLPVGGTAPRHVSVTNGKIA